MSTRKQMQLGLSEQELREAITDELTLAVRTERGLTIHALAHSIARVLELDHLRIAEQLERAGVRLGDPERSSA
ncbi:MAG: hypothetical protein RMM28_07235 [Thermoleophilia bacterium]|nr:hypothetical protein [Gaiellaceae bacterium]MDW8338912.1 hypothetical protein [Thermoleophilia bacterium]